MLEAAAIVLAGGKSTRMGRDKTLVRVKKTRMLEGTVKLLADEFPEIIVSANTIPQDVSGVTTIADIMPGRGPLGGIHASLIKSQYHNNFIIACDMPFIDIRLAVYMVSLAEAGHDAVVPRLGKYYQPLFSVYSKNCIPAIEKSLKQGRNQIISFYYAVKTRFVSLDEIKKIGEPDTIFFNVNTPGDLDTAKKMALGEVADDNR